MSIFKIFIINTLFFYLRLIKNKNNFLVDKFLILLIRSNHPKRYFHEYKKFNNKLNFNSIIFDKKNYQNLNIFIGDSHSEFYGRNYPALDKDKNLNLTYWVGPILLMDLISSKEVSKKIINFVNFISNKVRYSKLNIILCFGEIDIRNSFYKILQIKKNFSNVNELLFFIQKNLQKKIIFIKKKIHIKKYDIFFYSIQPVSNKQGMHPKNIKELIKINNKDFSTLGDLRTRVYWRKKLENCLFKNQSKIGFKYLKHNKNIFDPKNNAINLKFTMDNIHTSDPVLLFKYQNKINRCKK
jgi:hypothetical protein